MGSQLLDFVLRNITTFAYALGAVLVAPFFAAELGGERHVGWLRHFKLPEISALFSPIFLVAALSLTFSKGCDTHARTLALNLPQLNCSQDGNTRLLVFVHGWMGDSQGTWKAFPDLACHDPDLKNTDVLAVDYPLFMVRRNLNISELASWLNGELDNSTLKGNKYSQIAVIAHSMGGLIAREIILDRRLAGRTATVGVLVEVATPHLGANPAQLAEAFGLTEPLTSEMQHDSEYLRDLRTHWNNLGDQHPKTHCFTSPEDLIVSQESAWFQCDDLRPYTQWGHIAMVKPANAEDDRYRLPIGIVSAFFQTPVTTRY
jgi:pimeloyl-ACP methyl ester carboxylesterase